MKTIEVNEQTYRAIELAGRLTGMSHGAVVERLVARLSEPAQDRATTIQPVPEPNSVSVYADYNGQRTMAMFEPLTTRIDIVSGPLSGSRHKTPSAAARAVVAAERPDVNSNRNGWTFWRVDGTNEPLESRRR